MCYVLKYIPTKKDVFLLVFFWDHFLLQSVAKGSAQFLHVAMAPGPVSHPAASEPEAVHICAHCLGMGRPTLSSDFSR